MKKQLTIAIACCFLSVVAGCFLGDHSAVRMVRLRTSPTAGQNSLNNTEIEEAQKIIDGVLSSNGLKRIPNQSTPSPDGAIAHYEGSTTKGCSISLRNQELTVMFLEFGQRKSSAPVKGICGSLEKELKGRYGSERVRIETRH